MAFGPYTPGGQLRVPLDLKPSCFLLVVLVSASLCGCVTIEVITPERLSGQQFAADSVPVAHIRADNWGWYLFNFVPLIAGNAA